MYLDNDDNKITGTIGALLGAALATGIWCLIGSFGVISYIGGFVLCLCAFGGYFLLGMGLSKTGLVITAVIVLISVYIATRLSFSIQLYHALEGGISLWKCFGVVMNMLGALGEKGAFYKELAIGYGLTAAGAFGLMYKLGVFEE